MSEMPEGRYTEATTTEEDPDCELFDMEAFRTNGLVWALNRYVLHPRGLAMSWFTEEGHDQPRGWQILRSDDGVWAFDTETELLGRAKFDAFLAYVAARKVETP
jgi:hypothetical protein